MQKNLFLLCPKKILVGLFRLKMHKKFATEKARCEKKLNYYLINLCLLGLYELDYIANGLKLCGGFIGNLYTVFLVKRH